MQNIIKEKPPWFDQKISDLINIPNNNNFKKCIVSINKNTTNEKYVFTDTKKNNILELNIKNIDKRPEQYEMAQNYHKKLEKKITNISKKYDGKKKQTMIKTAITKATKNIRNINKTTICKQYIVYPTNDQKIVLNKWLSGCTTIYNKCVDLYNNNNKYFDKGYMSVKLNIFNMIYGNNEKSVPYDILTDEIKIFCSNLKSNRTNVERGHRNHFNMHHKKVLDNQCIFLPKTCVSKDGFYKNHLGKMEGMNIDHEIDNDCRLNYDKLKNRYILLVPINIKVKDTPPKYPVVALDPGEKIFQSYYSLEEFGHIGKDMRIPILKIEKNIRKYQRALNNGTNKNGEKLINKKNLKIKIRKCYEKIKNITQDLRNKTALYLCKNYDHILIPEFKTQNMIRNFVNANHKRINKIFAEKGKHEGMEELKKYNKRRRLNGRVKFVLNMLSHYKFRQHLSNKCAEYGCEMHVVTEEYTSKTCTKCGMISDKYKCREKDCIHCGYKINRDINGSRNILIKNIGLIRQMQ